MPFLSPRPNIIPTVLSVPYSRSYIVRDVAIMCGRPLLRKGFLLGREDERTGCRPIRSRQTESGSAPLTALPQVRSYAPGNPGVHRANAGSLGVACFLETCNIAIEGFRRIRLAFFISHDQDHLQCYITLYETLLWQEQHFWRSIVQPSEGRLRRAQLPRRQS